MYEYITYLYKHIKVIDETYWEYMRCFNVIFAMRKIYPDLTFYLAEPMEASEYDVDIKVKDWHKIIAGIKVSDILCESKGKDIFHAIYSANIITIISPIQGEIKNPLPIF